MQFQKDVAQNKESLNITTAALPENKGTAEKSALEKAEQDKILNGLNAKFPEAHFEVTGGYTVGASVVQGHPGIIGGHRGLLRHAMGILVLCGHPLCEFAFAVAAGAGGVA